MRQGALGAAAGRACTRRYSVVRRPSAGRPRAASSARSCGTLMRLTGTTRPLTYTQPSSPTMCPSTWLSRGGVAASAASSAPFRTASPARAARPRWSAPNPQPSWPRLFNAPPPVPRGAGAQRHLPLGPRPLALPAPPRTSHTSGEAHPAVGAWRATVHPAARLASTAPHSTAPILRLRPYTPTPPRRPPAVRRGQARSGAVRHAQARTVVGHGQRAREQRRAA
jgi:hypothetical protein